jgi:hypothetical protein
MGELAAGDDTLAEELTRRLLVGGCWGQDEAAVLEQVWRWQAAIHAGVREGGEGHQGQDWAARDVDLRGLRAPRLPRGALSRSLSFP